MERNNFTEKYQMITLTSKDDSEQKIKERLQGILTTEELKRCIIVHHETGNKRHHLHIISEKNLIEKFSEWPGMVKVNYANESIVNYMVASN